MNNCYGHFLHPEIRKEIIKEFHRLKKKHPSLSGEELMAYARDYVYTVCTADSAIVRHELSLRTA